MKYLFIAEKPSEMKAVKAAYLNNKSEVDEALGGSIDFIALAGHVFRNAEPKEYEEWNRKWKELYEGMLPMVPKKWVILPIPTAKDIISKVKAAVKETTYDGIIVGTDSDTEGYGIYYLVAEALKLKKYKTLRFYATSLAEKDVVKSLTSMTDFYSDEKHRNAVNAYIFRSHWDWLIGMNLSVAYTVHSGNLMKVGSVKSPTLKLIYDNCKAIDEFVPHSSYNVVLTYDNDVKGKHTEDDKNEYKFETKEEAEEFMKTLGKTATVLSYAKKNAQTKAPKLYSLSDLQVDASAKYGFSPEDTLSIAQKLYEERKVLSYPRTSGNYVTKEKATEFPALLKSLLSIPELKQTVVGIGNAAITRATSDGNIVNDKEVAKAAHDALLPTGEKIEWNDFTDGEKKIFTLVAKRFLAHFMDLYFEEKHEMLTDNEGNHFISSGVKVINHGWKALYEEAPKNKPLPSVKAGDVLNVKAIDAEERTTQAPKRLTTGSLISVMKNIGKNLTDAKLKKVMNESEGIGTEATRAKIIDSLSEKINGGEGYITVKKNAIFITETGKTYIENLYNGIEDEDVIANPYSVAYWSYRNKQIELGEATVDEVMTEFLEYLKKVIKKVQMTKTAVKKDVKLNDAEGLGKCPVCGGEVMTGKFGPYCMGKCGFKPDKVLKKELTENQIKTLLSGKPLTLNGLLKKDGTKYNATVIMTGVTESEYNGKKYYYPKVEFVDKV